MDFKINAAERMRIDASGNVAIGTTSASAKLHVDTSGTGIISTGTVLVGVTSTLSSGDEGVQLGTNGMVTTARNQTSDQTHMAFINPNGQRGRIYTSGNNAYFSNQSDQRLKENIVDAPAGNIEDIQVRSFDWKFDGEHKTYGMIAQELFEVAPYAVSQGQTEDEMWGIDDSKLVPMMIKEIQELKAKVAALEAK